MSELPLKSKDKRLKSLCFHSNTHSVCIRKASSRNDKTSAYVFVSEKFFSKSAYFDDYSSGRVTMRHFVYMHEERDINPSESNPSVTRHLCVLWAVWQTTLRYLAWPDLELYMYRSVYIVLRKQGRSRSTRGACMPNYIVVNHFFYFPLPHCPLHRLLLMDIYYDIKFFSEEFVLRRRLISFWKCFSMQALAAWRFWVRNLLLSKSFAYTGWGKIISKITMKI